PALAARLAAVLAVCSLQLGRHRAASPVPGDWPGQPKVQYGGYDRPPSLSEQSAQAVAPSGAVPAADIGWREFFRDPRLQALIELSLVNNRDLRIAVERVEEARAQYGVQRGSQWPSIGLGGEGTRQRVPANLNPQGRDTVGNTFQAGIG